jgi:hypothetical protein
MPLARDAGPLVWLFMWIPKGKNGQPLYETDRRWKAGCELRPWLPGRAPGLLPRCEAAATSRDLPCNTSVGSSPAL